MNQIEQTSVGDILRISEDPEREIFVRSNIGFIRSLSRLSESEYRNIEVFRATDYQITVVKEGSIDIECNLQPITLTSENILIFSPGTLIYTKKKSPDYDATVISLNAQAVDSVKPFGFRLMENTKPEIPTHYVSLIASLCTNTKGDSSIIFTILSFIDYLMEQYQDDKSKQWQKNDRRSQIFKSFMSLVNDNGRWHHLSEYYAQKLCISLNYLNDIVKEKSGRTVFMWICDYLITEAKAQLLHSSNNVQQVSDYLDFPNSAFFCRFFKKHTGFTPLQFRKLRLI